MPTPQTEITRRYRSRIKQERDELRVRNAKLTAAIEQAITALSLREARMILLNARSETPFTPRR